MFQFPWFPLDKSSAWVLPRPVSRLGNPRLGLLDSSPGLIAVLPRPSSATDAKASALCPFFFDLHQSEHKTKKTSQQYSVFKEQNSLVYTKLSLITPRMFTN
jgi:hypothetical protein